MTEQAEDRDWIVGGGAGGPGAAVFTMADELRFLCDEMLVGLGRWLRIAGYEHGDHRTSPP